MHGRVEQVNRREREFEAQSSQSEQIVPQGYRVDGIENQGGDIVRQISSENYHRIRLPSFSANDTEMWFGQVEYVFERYGVESEIARVQIIISQVDAETLSCVRYIVMASPKPKNAYTQIKNELVANFPISKEARVLQLIRGDVLVGGKPSQMLSRLRNLNTGECNDEVMKTIFISKLPHQHQLL